MLEEGQKSHTYIAFYVIAISETIVTTVVSCCLRVISFKGTHLVQRMSLLTLIILGEGVIGLTKSIAELVSNSFIFNSDTIGQIISSVLIIVSITVQPSLSYAADDLQYFFYMLYFDRCDTESHFGTIRQQIWAFLHFPLHIALVLVLEGVSQTILWHRALTYSVDTLTDIDDAFNAGANDTSVTIEDVVDNVNATAWADVFESVPAKVDISESLNQVNEALEQILDAHDKNQTEPDIESVITSAADSLRFALVNTILESLGIEAPESTGENAEPETSEDATMRLSKVYDLIYVYLFIAVSHFLRSLHTRHNKHRHDHDDVIDCAPRHLLTCNRLV